MVSWEPIAAYRYYAAGALAILQLAAALARSPRERPVSPETLFRDADIDANDRTSWGRLREISCVWQEKKGKTWEEWWETDHGHAVFRNLSSVDPGLLCHNFSRNSLEFELLSPEECALAQRRKLGWWFSENWLKKSGLTPIVTWDGERQRLGLAVGAKQQGRFEMWPPNSLFRVIVAQMAAQICAGTYSATCSHCGAPYFSERRVRLDQAHYCASCKATAPSRRVQRSRERKRMSLTLTQDE